MKEKKVSWLELFFDLVFVSAISYTTHILVNADHHPDLLSHYLVEFLLMTFPMFWLWVGQTMFFNRFSEFLRLQTIFMLPQMFCLIFMTASLDFDFTHIYHNLIIGYIGFRLLTLIQYYIVGRQKLNNAQCHAASLLSKIFTLGIIITAASVFFHNPWHFIIMYLGILLDLVLPLFFGKTLALASVNLPHLTERLGAFVIIAFGESLVSIASILTDATTNAYTIIFTVAGFLLISLMWYSYFYDFENFVGHTNKTGPQRLLYGHFFVLTAIMILAADLHMLYAGVLDKDILLAFLFGAGLVFFIFKHLIFYRHRQHKIAYNLRKMAAVFLLMIICYLADLIFSFPAYISILLLVGCFGLEIALQKRPSA